MNAWWTGCGTPLSIALAVTGCAGGVIENAGAGDDASGVTDAGTDAAATGGPDSGDSAAAPFEDGSAPPPADSGGVMPGPDSGPLGGGSLEGGAPDAGDAGPGDAGAGDAGATDAQATSACTGKTRLTTASNPVIGDFEDSSLTGWYDYQSSGALNKLVIGSPGALGTGHAGHLAAAALTSFGAGMGVQTVCWDTSALDGVSFWAKGIAGADNKFQFQVAIPATHSVADGGDCVSNCFDHPSKQLVFTPDWSHYVVAFSDLAQAGWGTPAKYTGVIMALNWVSVDATDVDFWVDEALFYKGTAPSGPVADAGAP